MRHSLVVAVALSTAALIAADQPAPPLPEALAPAPAPQPPPPPPAPLTAEQQMQVFQLQGFLIARQANLGSIVTELGLNEAELEALFAGMRLAAKGETPAFKIEPLIAGADHFLGERAAARTKAWTDANAAFLAKLDADTTITKTASGLRYRIVEAGAAEKPAATSSVTAYYTGKLCDGRVFDSARKGEGDALTFELNRVIRGWTEGMQLIGKGGKILLWVPADLGYGPQGQGPIPGGSVLEFEVELVDFK